MTNRRNTFRLGSIVLIVSYLVIPSTFAAADELIYSTQEQVFSDTQNAPCRDEDRLAAVSALFKRFGASDTDIAVVEKPRNLVVTLKGAGPGYLVVGAHYDKVNAGCGAIDNWTGVVLLTHVYKALRQSRPNRTILFVAFGGEETGLKGSKAMVAAIAKQDRASYCAMVNLDSFGLARPQVLENATTRKLLNFVRVVAEKCKVPIASASLEGVADADSSSFKSAGIPAVTLHGLSNDWFRIIHTQRDNVESIKSASVYLGYILCMNLVGQLDGCECNAFR